MALSYNDLLTEVPIFLLAQNRDLALAMPAIVRQAEDQVIGLLDHDAFQTRMSPNAQVDPGSPVINLEALGSPILEVRSLRCMGDGMETPLERRNIERLLVTFSPYDSGYPLYYAEDGSPHLLRIFPVPDMTYQIVVMANVEPNRLSPDIQTNLLTQQFPRVIETAVYTHAAKFMRNPNDEARYEKQFAAALTEANAQIARRRRDETAPVQNTIANVAG